MCPRRDSGGLCLYLEESPRSCSGINLQQGRWFDCKCRDGEGDAEVILDLRPLGRKIKHIEVTGLAPPVQLPQYA